MRSKTSQPDNDERPADQSGPLGNAVTDPLARSLSHLLSLPAAG
jgi:hypothetical protein